MLKLDNVTVSYGENIIIQNLSYDFSDNRRYAIMGMSGIGKTTLLNTLAGIQKPISGKIISTYEKPSYIFQEPRLFPWLTTIENISSVCKDKEKAYFILKKLITDNGVENKYPHELSGGMQQRVAIARALAYDFDIIFMDEPFKGLDEETCNFVRSFVFEELKNKPAILVTHNIEDTQYCHYLLKMEGYPTKELTAEESGSLKNE